MLLAAVLYHNITVSSSLLVLCRGAKVSVMSADSYSMSVIVMATVSATQQ